MFSCPLSRSHTPSLLPLQKTMNDMSQVIFSRAPKINMVDIQMPNIHYFVGDLSKLQIPNQGEV